MTDIWVCATCHSINRQRVSRCYKCGGSRDKATGEGSTMRVEQALANRTVVPYRSAWFRGAVAAVLILSVAAIGIVLLLASLDDVAWIKDQVAVVANGGSLATDELNRRLAGLAGPGLLKFGLTVAAVFAFGAWLSRVVTNIPALGGGVPSTTPTKAFVYPIIPIWNLIKVPGMIQDALYRVDANAGGFFMVALAWFGLVGSWIVGTVASWFIDIRLAAAVRAARTAPEVTTAVQSSFDQALALDVLTTFMVSAGAMVLVIVMLRIERRSAARDSEIRAAAAGTAAEPSTATAPSTAIAQEGAFVPAGDVAREPVGSGPRRSPFARSLSAAAFAVPAAPAVAATPAVAAPPSAVAAPPPGETQAPVEASAVAETAEPAEPVADAQPPVEPAVESIVEPEVPTPVEPVVQTPVAATVKGKAPSGPHLAVVVHADGAIVATVDADPERITLEELGMVADALAQANGTASVATADSAADAHFGEVVAVLNARGIPVESDVHPDPA